MKTESERLLERGNFGQFGATVGFDALRIAMGGQPRIHDVDMICRWLRHVAKMQGTESPAMPVAAPSSDR